MLINDISVSSFLMCLSVIPFFKKREREFCLFSLPGMAHGDGEEDYGQYGGPDPLWVTGLAQARPGVCWGATDGLGEHCVVLPYESPRTPRCRALRPPACLRPRSSPSYSITAPKPHRTNCQAEAMFSPSLATSCHKPRCFRGHRSQQHISITTCSIPHASPFAKGKKYIFFSYSFSCFVSAQLVSTS